MLVRLAKRHNQYPAGTVVDLPKDEAESLIAFDLAFAMPTINAEAPTRLVERAKVKKDTETATVPTEALSVAEITEHKA